MADKKVNTGLLWAILVLAIADVAFIISFKMEFIPAIAEKISETTADMISELFLLFFLIVLILYVPGRRAKRKKKIPAVEVTLTVEATPTVEVLPTVEVTPIVEPEEILFIPAPEENGDIVEVEEYHSVQEGENEMDDEGTAESEGE